MLHELTLLLDARPGSVDRKSYASAALEENCLGKRTASTRKLSFQRLSELYGLDPAIPLFRILRDLWPMNKAGRPLLALLLALARDPLLRAAALPVLETPIGVEFTRQGMADALANKTQGRFNASILGKIVRNASSSWTQSGHLQGRVRKIRKRAEAHPISCAYALLLGYLMGKRGPALFDSPWIRVLDLEKAEVLEIAEDANRLGILNMKQSGSIIDISFPQLLSDRDRELMHESH